MSFSEIDYDTGSGSSENSTPIPPPTTPEVIDSTIRIGHEDSLLIEINKVMLFDISPIFEMISSYLEDGEQLHDPITDISLTIRGKIPIPIGFKISVKVPGLGRITLFNTAVLETLYIPGSGKLTFDGADIKLVEAAFAALTYGFVTPKIGWRAILRLMGKRVKIPYSAPPKDPIDPTEAVIAGVTKEIAAANKSVLDSVSSGDKSVLDALASTADTAMNVIKILNDVNQLVNLSTETNTNLESLLREDAGLTSLMRKLRVMFP